jgi:ankyrin repeat protein
MHAAARKDGLEIVRRLLASGAAVNARDWRGATALRYALFGSAETVSALIRAGADVDARDNSGATVLSIALADGNAAAAKILREAGARK